MYKATIIFLFSLFFSVSFSQTDSLTLDYPMAERLAALPLECIDTEYPNKLNQVLTDSSYLNSPKDLHPIFYGCFDWHSSVHGYWLLACIMNKFPGTELEKKIIHVFDKNITAENVAKELAYFEPKLEKSFERTYGWAWFLKFYAELSVAEWDNDHQWTENLTPLKDYIVDAYKSFLPKLVYPIRVGEHTNTAFGISLALDYANIVEDLEFAELLKNRSRDYFFNDQMCPLNWEPSGFDFISPCLYEAELMTKVLDPIEYKFWIKKFLPDLTKKDFSIEPGKVLDRTDGKLVHLDGLNFSRATCLYRIAFFIPKNYDHLRKVADDHVNASMNYVAGSDYMGSHWLATFLMQALVSRDYNQLLHSSILK